MSLFFDHVVLNVKDLKQAIKDFENAGFTVVSGGVHKGGLSENALIFFQDDTFIELFTTTRGIKVSLLKLLKRIKALKAYQYSRKWGLAYRFYSRAIELPEGIADICFLSDDYDKEHQRINDSGLFLTKSLKAGRKKPDGGYTKWEMSCPFINELPFIRSGYYPAKEIPGDWKQHDNGITGISRMTVLAQDFKDMSSKYETFLGVNRRSAKSDEEKSWAKFQLKTTMVEVIKASENKEILNSMRGKGLGIYAMAFSSLSDFSALEGANLHGLTVIESKG